MTASNAIAISFIIPAYNEEDNIAETLVSIDGGAMLLPFEVIVVDHDSTDSTAAIALQHHANVVRKKGGTVASVRNAGVQQSSGRILVFLDADVSLTEEWFRNIGKAVRLIDDSNSTITGSFCSTEGNGGLIEKYWFANLVNRAEVNYLGTGHMIVSRELFLEVGGFDEALSTGEDYAFCRAVLEHGGSIVADPDLRVVHRDFPKNIYQFIRREAWHGTGDVTSIAKMLGSKVVLATLVFVISHLLAVFVVLSCANSLEYASVPAVAVLALLVTSSYTKFSAFGLRVVAINTAIFYFYYVGRSLSFLSVLGFSIQGHKRG